MHVEYGESVARVIAAVKAGAPSPFTLERLRAVSEATFAVGRSVRSGNAEGLVR